MLDLHELDLTRLSPCSGGPKVKGCLLLPDFRRGYYVTSELIWDSQIVYILFESKINILSNVTIQHLYICSTFLLPFTNTK